MKKMFQKRASTALSALILAFASGSTMIAAASPADLAQTPQSDRRTAIGITLDVTRQEVIAGPYARYAQRFLGVSAPLADKVTHEITSAKVFDINDLPQTPKATQPAPPATHMNPDRGFPRLTVDKTSAAAISLEESARLAAEKIFEIRKSRLDLITGEVGENVFGGGLGSALAELNRLEEEYLSLFLGRQSTRTEFGQYRIIPTRGKPTYIVCRFSETDGLHSGDDLSGVPVVLELKSESDSAAMQTAAQARPSSRAVAVQLPADMSCRLIYEGSEIASQVITILQMGETAYITQ